jgi:hypothetical protein
MICTSVQFVEAKRAREGRNLRFLCSRGAWMKTPRLTVGGAPGR